MGSWSDGDTAHVAEGDLLEGRFGRWIPAGLAAAVLAGLAALVLGIGGGRGADEPAAPPSTAVAAVVSSTTSTSTSTRPSTTTTSAPRGDDHVDPGEGPAVVAAAQRFLAAWAAPGSPEERRAALAPVASPQLVEMLADVALDELPASVGRPELAGMSGTAAAVVAPVGRGRSVSVALTRTGAGWVATDLRWAS